MENIIFDGEKDSTEEQLLDSDAMSDEEEGFMKGYSTDEEIEECSECGGAINPEKKVVRVFEDEKYLFCSEECAKEFEENLED
tara:strand:+ start:159 stop:407 length:249 start_codon:yes stop_codon:yes gene_type:complete